MTPTLTVSQLLSGVEQTLASAYPGPVWVRGEISGYRRTNRGAAFFRLVDPDCGSDAVEVSARARAIEEISRTLTDAGVGVLRSGIEVRLEATVGVRRGAGHLQLSLLSVDPEFIAGKLAVDRTEVLRKLTVEKLIDANALLPVPLVPLRIGLVTSRDSAAHADFLKHLASPGYRFSVRTVETVMQGEQSPARVVAALDRLATEAVDMVAVVRGGGASLDLAAFDDESVARRIATMPVPVITGIGHETDRSVADEVAAVAEKTPTAAAGWLVARVAEYAGRIETARREIAGVSRAALERVGAELNRLSGALAGSRQTLRRQEDLLSNLGSGVADAARSALARHRSLIDNYAELISTMGLERTLRRGFAVVTHPDGSAVREASSLSPGDRVGVRMADGKVWMEVVGRDE